MTPYLEEGANTIVHSFNKLCLACYSFIACQYQYCVVHALVKLSNKIIEGAC